MKGDDLRARIFFLIGNLIVIPAKSGIQTPNSD
jgi:hypothetical protein